MIALFTETFEDFLKRNETSEAWQKIVAKLNLFPRFTLAGLDFDMYTLLKEKYAIHEIGEETEAGTGRGSGHRADRNFPLCQQSDFFLQIVHPKPYADPVSRSGSMISPAFNQLQLGFSGAKKGDLALWCGKTPRDRQAEQPAVKLNRAFQIVCVDGNVTNHDGSSIFIKIFIPVGGMQEQKQKNEWRRAERMPDYCSIQPSSLALHTISPLQLSFRVVYLGPAVLRIVVGIPEFFGSKEQAYAVFRCGLPFIYRNSFQTGPAGQGQIVVEITGSGQ